MYKRIKVLARAFLLKLRGVVTFSNKMIACYELDGKPHRLVITKLCREKRR